MEIAVIGAGSYGTCLAKHLGDQGYRTRLWCRSERLAAEIAETRENSVYLPGFTLKDTVDVHTELQDCVTGAELVVGVTPSHAIRDVLGRASAFIRSDAIVVNASKGLEDGTLKRIDQIYADVLGEQHAQRATYLSGPTFAQEVAAGLPSAMVVAALEQGSAELVQDTFSNEYLRVYSSDDIIGVQVGGALKNVVAICAGLSDGLGFGHNARAALITRGLAEISRMGAAMGANPLTFAGLSGVGDLVLTCAGDLSRNRRVGLALARGKALEEIVAEMQMVAEGVKTARVAHELSRELGVDAPLTDFIYSVLYEEQEPRQGIANLMSRALRPELD
jgi:glycerol-3-phosphate dehydrogenase (NAD(P)+)